MSGEPPARGGRQTIPRPVEHRLSGPPPWADRAIVPEFGVVVARLRAAGAPRPIAPGFAGARLSAVLVVVHDGPLGAEVVLTRRSERLRSHSGEISFPGGRADPGEPPLAAALREAHEEVGLDSTRVRIVGELDHLDTVVSRSYIVPIVAAAEARPELHAAPDEVERILHVPLAELLAPGAYRGELWGPPEVERPLHFFELADETVWGATGRILVDLLDVVAG